MKQLIKIEKMIAVTLLSIAGSFGMFNIFARYIFGIGWPWSDGIIVMFTIWGSFIASAVVIEQKEHIVIDAFIERLKPRLYKIAVIIANLLTIIFVSALLVLSLNHIKFLFDFGGTSLQTYLPAWLEFIGIPLSLLLMTFHSIHRTIATIRGVD
jgi:TRAP-type C4-dicarboxylate transport system permease small subunit